MPRHRFRRTPVQRHQALMRRMLRTGNPILDRCPIRLHRRHRMIHRQRHHIGFFPQRQEQFVLATHLFDRQASITLTALLHRQQQIRQCQMRHAYKGFDVAGSDVALDAEGQRRTVFAAAKHSAQRLGVGDHPPRLRIQQPRFITDLDTARLAHE